MSEDPFLERQKWISGLVLACQGQELYKELPIEKKVRISFVWSSERNVYIVHAASAMDWQHVALKYGDV